jgi:hypothetical protein
LLLNKVEPENRPKPIAVFGFKKNELRRQINVYMRMNAVSMSIPNMTTVASSRLLSTELNRSVSARFFKPLYFWRDLSIDLLNHLAPAFSRGRRCLPRSEVLALIEELIAHHPAVRFPEDQSASLKEWNQLNYRANYYLRQLVEVGWIIEDEFRYNLKKVTLSLDSNAHALLAFLQDISSSSLSTSARFSDTFRSVLDTILDPTRRVFGPQDEKPYGRLKDLLDRCSKGMLVLRRIENVLRRFTHEQAETLSRRRNLELVADELQQLTRTQYYQELQDPSLFARCTKAVARLDEVFFVTEDIARIAAECLQRGEATDDADAELRVRAQLTELSNLLNGLRGEATQIEQWASRFLKTSLAKFRHLQVIPSRQVEIARARMAAVAEAIKGKRWWQELPVEKLPPCRLPDYGFVWGTSSLYQAPSARPVLPPQRVRRPSACLDEDVIAQLALTRRKALTPERANDFIARNIANIGGVLASHELNLATSDDLLDVVACFCYAASPKANFKIVRAKPEKGVSRYVPAGHWLLERFTLHRTR